jgi:hypothetical protein
MFTPSPIVLRFCSGIRRLLKFVSEKVASKFSDMRLLSLGNLLFLRFLNPGVLTPNPGIPGTTNPVQLEYSLFVCWLLTPHFCASPPPPPPHPVISQRWSVIRAVARCWW